MAALWWDRDRMKFAREGRMHRASRATSDVTHSRPSVQIDCVDAGKV
jgi:hypothetical protein